MSPATTWTNEQATGQAWLYNNEGLSYNADQFDDFEVYYNSMGITTTWTVESK